MSLHQVDDVSKLVNMTWTEVRAAMIPVPMVHCHTGERDECHCQLFNNKGTEQKGAQ